MSTNKVPNSNKQWIQSNNGDYQGNLYETYNCDLDSEPGVLKNSRKLERVDIYNNTQFPLAMQIYNGNYYIAFYGGGTDEVWRCGTNNDPTNAANWSEVADLSGAPEVIETDMTSFNGLLLISDRTDIWSWEGSDNDDWWTTVAGGGGLTTSKPHQMEVLRSGADTLFVTDGNKVRYYNSAAGNTVITLDTLMTAGCLTPSLDRMWVGTYTEVENNAFVYELRAGDDSAFQAYPVDGRACLAMFTYRNTPFVITEMGYVQMFNGAGFQTVAQFPWATSSTVMYGCRPGLIQDSPRAKAIHPKGVKIKGNYAYIFVNAEDEFNPGDLLNRGYSGVWVLDLTTYSLTHRYSVGTAKVSNVGPLLITNTPDTRLMVGATTVADGDGVWMETTTTPFGYFVPTRHESDSVADVFETFVYKTDTLASGSSVQVKRKDTEQPGFPYFVDSVTWLDETRFNTTDALTNVAVGDEVFITDGQGADNLCHITAITTGSVVNTVTVDESLGVLNETSDIKIDKWTKLNTDRIEANGEYFKLGVANDAKTFAQYKVVLTGDVTVRETISQSNNKNGL